MYKCEPQKITFRLLSKSLVEVKLKIDVHVKYFPSDWKTEMKIMVWLFNFLLYAEVEYHSGNVRPPNLFGFTKTLKLFKNDYFG